MNHSTVLIADGGSTKTDWTALCNGKKILEFQTKGFNPFFLSDEELYLQMTENVSSQLKQTDSPTYEKCPPIAHVYFYGAGCTFPAQCERLQKILKQSLDAAEATVESDLIGAARALCGRTAGIAGILGTGSNSCQWDGHKITRQISPLGFILGDEGSGAVLGKRLVSDVLKHQLPNDLEESFFATLHLTAAEIMERVYRQTLPNRFLASLSPFVKEHIDRPEINRLVCENFRDFFQRNIAQYAYHDLPVHLVGSIAYHYEKELRTVAEEDGFHVGQIVRSPIEGLIKYHTNS